MNCNYYPQQPHDPYGYQQQNVKPTFALDICGFYMSNK